MATGIERTAVAIDLAPVHSTAAGCPYRRRQQVTRLHRLLLTLAVAALLVLGTAGAAFAGFAGLAALPVD
jgi:hypothetical protein